jgi:hypothetical protein
VASCSNLEVTQGTIKINGSNLIGADRKIDYNTWIRNGPSFSNDGLSAAGITLGAAGLLSSLGGQLLSHTGQIGPTVAADIGKRLGEEITEEAWDASQSESNLQVHWNAIVFPPIHKNLNSHDVGFSSNVFVNSNAKLFSIRASDLTRVDGGRFRRIASNPSSNLVIDFAGPDFYGRNATIQNVLATSVTAPTVATSNVNATNVATSNLIGVNLVCSNVATQGLWMGAGGIYTGNPNTNPFATQVIDAQGFYKGTVAKEQVVGTEALDFGLLADGVLSLQGFSPANNYVNPFALEAQSSLFNLL